MIDVENVQPSCRECGMDVRVDTSFCYNCGTRLSEPVAEMVSEPPAVAENKVDDDAAAVAELSERLKIEEPPLDKVALAAAERKRARFRGRTPAEYSWEPVDDASSRVPFLLALLITAISAGIVFLAVIWR